MPRRVHGVDRLDHLEDVKESLYRIGRAVNAVRNLGITVNHSEVRDAEANYKNRIVNLVNEEVASILRNAESNTSVADQIQKLGRVIGRVPLR